MRRELLLLTVCTWSVALCDDTLSLSILHTNDVHARYDQINSLGGLCSDKEELEKRCYGGVARLMTKVKEIRKQDQNTLFVNAGDYYQGTLYFTQDKWNITADFTMRLGYDAVSLGNHEFDLGVEGLVPYLDRVTFPVLACNLDLSKEPSLQGKVKCSHEFIIQGQRVAVVGYVTPETKDLSNTSQVIFLDEVEVLQKVVKKLLDDGVNKIIAVGHSGYAVDQEIARKVKGLDVVVGGHTNTFLWNGPPPTPDEEVMGPYPTEIVQNDGSKVLVVQAYAYAKYLGYLKVTFDSNGRVTGWSGNPVLLDASVEMDKEIEAALAPYKAKVEAVGSHVVGSTSVYLQGDREQCRRRECNMGNMAADAAVTYFARPSSAGWTKYSISILNSGGIRANINERSNEGNITMGDVQTVFPFGNSLDYAGLYGKHLREAMEWSVHRYHPNMTDAPGEFLQVSGLQVSYDVSQPPGTRVVQLLARCSQCRVPVYKEVQDDQLYHLVVPTFILHGGDGFKVLKEKSINASNSGALDIDVILKELQRSSPLTNGEEGRIKFVEPKSCNNSVVGHPTPVGVLQVFLCLAIIGTHRGYLADI